MVSASQRPKVSIVVPVYNVEKYISNCLDSLVGQTMSDIEIIVVDDGSPDASGDIADNYAASDTRIRVLHQKNGGLGFARNSGIDAASGEFIGFVDSDDWVHRDYFESLYQASLLAKADIVVGGIETWTDGKLVNSEVHPLAGKTLCGFLDIQPYRKLFYGRLPGDFETEPFPVAVWTGIYKADLIKAAKITFDDVLSEDVFFNLQALKIANTVSYINSCGYCYRKDCQDSITRTYKDSTLASFSDFFQKLREFAQEEDEAEECVLRVDRKVVDYIRALAFMVEKSDMSQSQKCQALRKVVETSDFKRSCVSYPVNKLPFFQAAFLTSLIEHRFLAALFMVRIRMMIRGEK